MGELIVSESSIGYKKSQNSDELLLRIFKETYKDGVIVIDNDDNIIFINEIAKKLIGPLLQDTNDKKINIPYSISKERIVHLKVNPKKYRSISIKAAKFVLQRKKYHLLTIKKAELDKSDKENQAYMFEQSKNYLHYKYDFEKKKFVYINKNLKDLLNLKDGQSDLRSSIVSKIHTSDQSYFIEVVNELESSTLEECDCDFEISYRYKIEDNIFYIYDFIKIIKSDNKLKSIESNAIILNKSIKFINSYSENDVIQSFIGNNLSIGLYKIDLIKKTFDVSDSLYKFLGFNKDELSPLFDNFRKLIHPDDVENYILSNKNFLANKDKLFKRDFRIKLKNGNYKWISSRGTILSYDEIGQPSKIMGLFFDKTDDHNILKERDYYFKLFNSVLNYANDVIFVIDDKGKIHHLSQSVEKLTGVKNKDFLNKHLWDTMIMSMSDEDKEKTDYEFHKSSVLNFLRYTLQNGNAGANQSKHYSVTGNEYILETMLHPISKDKDDNFLIAIAKDLTGIKILQDEIKEREVIYNELMDNSTDAIIVFEPNNEIIIYANNVAAKLYGLTKNELINRSLIEFSIDKEFGAKKVMETINKKGIITFKSKHRNANGKRFDVHITASYVNYKEQNVILSINKFIKYIK